MKSCAYCGRANLDNATSCCECGTNEFEEPTSPPKRELVDVAIETPVDDVAIKPAADPSAVSRAEREREYLKTDLPADHYLLMSTEQELVEILARPNEWCGFDVAHARRLVLQRGIDLKRVEEKKAEHIRQLRRGRRASRKFIVCGWVFSVLGGLIGFGIAWSLVFMKEKTPYGEFFTYDDKSRAIGRTMLKLAGTMIAIGVILRLVSSMSQ
jgi:hypothetical protein